MLISTLYTTLLLWIGSDYGQITYNEYNIKDSLQSNDLPDMKNVIYNGYYMSTSLNIEIVHCSNPLEIC